MIYPGAATENDLREHCLRRLARYKVPERIALAEVLPRNAMGKVQRVQLTELFALEEEG
jgi:acyl-CoA synthetase (AMP-forming)/AMP-acid ligase II